MLRFLARYKIRRSEFPNRVLFSDSSKSEGDNDDGVKNDKDKSSERKAEYTRRLSAQKIQSILSSMKVTKSENKSDIQLDLAKPSPWKEVKSRLQASQPEVKSPELIEDEMMVNAVKDVAQNLGGDTVKTESELLQKLRLSGADNPPKNMTDLFAGIKIDRTKRKWKPGVPSDESEAAISNFVNVLVDTRRKHVSAEDVELDGGGDGIRRFRRDVTRYSQDEVLFEDGPTLGIFSKKEKFDTQRDDVLKTWDFLQKRQIKLMVTHPPANAFEEMIHWTEQGKLWQFPIDNEIGLDEERQVSFDKHIFLEEHLENGFPKRGPVRHFMELVVVGLSKNPYLTVQQKLDHIDWFRQYFKEKEPLLQELGALA